MKSIRLPVLDSEGSEFSCPHCLRDFVSVFKNIPSFSGGILGHEGHVP